MMSSKAGSDAKSCKIANTPPRAPSRQDAVRKAITQVEKEEQNRFDNGNFLRNMQQDVMPHLVSEDEESLGDRSFGDGVVPDNDAL